MTRRTLLAASLVAVAALISIPLRGQDQTRPQAGQAGQAGQARQPGQAAQNNQARQAGEADDAEVASPPSYLIGLSIGSQMQGQGFSADDIDGDSFLAGIRDALGEKEPRLSQEQLQAASQELEQMMRARMEQQQAELQGAAQENLQKSRQFLAQNAQKEGVKTLDSGLQYQVIEEGDGPSPTAEDTVRVHYTGRLIDGTVFDSSVQRGQPAEFPVGGVIPGWTEALQRMKVGGKWMLYIPPELAYGQQGSPGAIGPNEALIFEVELLDIVN